VVIGSQRKPEGQAKMAKGRIRIGGELTCREAGRLGGLSTLARRGRAHFSLIGARGQEVFATRYTLADRSRWGKMGGRPAKGRIGLGKRANTMRNGGMGSPLGSLLSSPSDEKTTLNGLPSEEKVVCGPSRGTYEEGNRTGLLFLRQ
jgi:hypothetical protein